MVTDRGHTASAERESRVLSAHGFHRLEVKRVVEETDDASSYVLCVPEGLEGTFRYRAGQFCTFRVRLDGEEYLRSYSMSSAPETDPDLTVTVKRVPGGVVSNWFLDHVSAGDVLELTRPAGVFCLGAEDRPVVAFCGGSGVTPVMSIAKSALATTDRPVSILYANRDRQSVIFDAAIRELRADHPDRLGVTSHFDSESGFVDATGVEGFLAGLRPGADPDFYICGPEPFMDLVETTLLRRGVSPERIFIERFGVGGPPVDLAGAETPAAAVPASEADVPESVSIILKGKKTQIPYHRGDTVLETARRGGLNPPFSCESGTCATCMAILRDGSASMRVNQALTPEEIEEGWILTCQALPSSAAVTVEYESF